MLVVLPQFSKKPITGFLPSKEKLDNNAAYELMNGMILSELVIIEGWWAAIVTMG